MKVYLVMHECFMEACHIETSEEIHEVCATEKIAIDCIKNIDISDCLTLGCDKSIKYDLEDVFDSDKNERTLCTDSHGYDRFYIIEKEVKGS